MTKRTWISWTLGSAAMLGLAYPVATTVARAEANAPAPVKLEHNPRIHAAIDALRAAKKELEEAKHDFHGKKQDALDAIQHAIDRLDEIKDWDD